MNAVMPATSLLLGNAVAAIVGKVTVLDAELVSFSFTVQVFAVILPLKLMIPSLAMAECAKSVPSAATRSGVQSRVFFMKVSKKVNATRSFKRLSNDAILIKLLRSLQVNDLNLIYRGKNIVQYPQM